MLTLCLTCCWNVKLFATVVVSFDISNNNEDSNLSISSKTFIIFYFIITILVGIKWYLTVVLIWKPLITDSNNFYHMLLDNLYVTFRRMSNQTSLLLFFNWLYVCSWLQLKIIYILVTNTLQEYDLQIFSPFLCFDSVLWGIF